MKRHRFGTRLLVAILVVSALLLFIQAEFLSRHIVNSYVRLTYTTERTVADHVAHVKQYAFLPGGVSYFLPQPCNYCSQGAHRLCHNGQAFVGMIEKTRQEVSTDRFVCTCSYKQRG